MRVIPKSGDIKKLKPANRSELEDKNGSPEPKAQNQTKEEPWLAPDPGKVAFNSSMEQTGW